MLIIGPAFMHNGVVSNFTKIRRPMSNLMSEAAFENVFGSTDSEHLAALYMTYLTDSAPASAQPFERAYPLSAMADAMHRAVSTVIALQREHFPDSKRIPNSLNLCATDGINLLAYRFRNHATSQPPSLYYSTKAGTTLNRKYPGDSDGCFTKGVTDQGKDPAGHGTHLIVASEPSTCYPEDWELVGRNQWISVDAEGEFKIGDVEYGEGWDAGGSS